jgi:hypothetical protein
VGEVEMRSPLVLAAVGKLLGFLCSHAALLPSHAALSSSASSIFSCSMRYIYYVYVYTICSIYIEKKETKKEIYKNTFFLKK